MASSFDRLGYHALMFCAGTRCSAGYDFTALGDELGAITPQDHLLVVYAFRYRFLGAKHTYFTPWLSELAWFAGWPASRWWRHLMSFPFPLGKNRVLNVLFVCERI